MFVCRKILFLLIWVYLPYTDFNRLTYSFVQILCLKPLYQRFPKVDALGYVKNYAVRSCGTLDIHDQKN